MQVIKYRSVELKINEKHFRDYDRIKFEKSARYAIAYPTLKQTRYNDCTKMKG